MSNGNNPTGENYRFSSVGSIKVYGNSVEIEEHFNPISDEVRKKEVQRETEHIEYVNELFEQKFQDHVMEYGIDDFENHPLWFNGKNYYPQNEVDESKRPSEIDTPKRERGDIVEFSAKSRYRMLKKLHMMNPDCLERFYSLTLTYPATFPEDGKTHKADLDAFIKRLKRKFGDVIEYLWKLEFQKRGAPHYHMIIHLSKAYKVPYLQRWVAENWYQVAQRFWDEKIENHLQAGTELQKIKNIQSASRYLSKYLNKDLDDTPKNQGRFWGCSRNWGVLMHEAELTGRQLIRFRRIVKKLARKNSKRMGKMVTLPITLTIFGHWRYFVQALEWVEQVH